MFDLKSLSKAIQQIAEEKNIPQEKIVEAVESSIAAAYKKEYEKRGEVIRAEVDLKTGNEKFSQVKIVVDETVVDMTPPAPEDTEGQATPADGQASETKENALPHYNPDRHILIEDARKIKADVQLNEEIEFPLETKGDFGRIAAQVAKQVVLQKIREAERDSVLSEFKEKEGGIISGVIQRFDRGNVYIDLGRATGIMFYNESIPGEHYRIGERMRFYVLAVQGDARGPGIILSRAHPDFVQKLFALEAPEIADNTVEIKAIAREAGSRTKIAVISHTEGVDPVGCCVGQRGMRVIAVSNELGQEKIDIVEWSEDPNKFVTNSLSPAKVRLVEIFPRREARALVADDQLSLAIGKGGQNVRLAAKLTGWKIDVRSQANPEQVLEEGVAESQVLEKDKAATPLEEAGEPRPNKFGREENPKEE